LKSLCSLPKLDGKTKATLTGISIDKWHETMQKVKNCEGLVDKNNFETAYRSIMDRYPELKKCEGDLLLQAHQIKDVFTDINFEINNLQLATAAFAFANM